MTQEVCNAKYVRSQTGITEQYRCTFPLLHDIGPDSSVHSWKWIKDADEKARAERKAREALDAERGISDDAPNDVQALLDAITAGNADPYLEAILAVTHNRKRALRGTPGFGRVGRG